MGTICAELSPTEVGSGGLAVGRHTEPVLVMGSTVLYTVFI